MVMPISTASNIAGKPIRVGRGPDGDRDHPQREDRLRDQPRVRHGDPDHGGDRPGGRAIKVGKQPTNLAITRDGKTVYVVDSNPFGASGSVIPIRVVSNRPGKPVKVGRFPFGIAIDP